MAVMQRPLMQVDAGLTTTSGRCQPCAGPRRGVGSYPRGQRCGSAPIYFVSPALREAGRRARRPGAPTRFITPDRSRDA